MIHDQKFLANQIKFQLFPISNSNKKKSGKDSRGPIMEKKERKERKEKEKDIEHIPSIPYRKRKRISCAQMAAPPPPPSLPAFVRVAQKLLQLFFIAKLAPLPVFFHPFFVDPFLSLSYIPPLPSLTRDYRGREKLVGGDWISFLRATSACDYRDSGNCPTSRLLFFRLHV